MEVREKDNYKEISEKTEKRVKYIIAAILGILAMGYIIILVLEFFEDNYGNL